MKSTRADASRKSEQPRPPAPRAGRTAGAAGLLAFITLVLGVLVGNRPNITDQSALHAFLETDGTRLFVAWLVTTASGLAWLCFIVGMRALLPRSFGRDVFTLAAIAGQAATWFGSALETATAPEGAHHVPLSVYTAFGEAGHLAGAAGIAATGLALTGMASAMRLRPAGWPRYLARLTTGAGILLILTAPIGPASLPVLVLWTAAASVTALRLPGVANVDS
jgi:predicted small integral membrane protein